ncbi:hypothetical protein A4S06_00305 [Erysipelotrichaceae bacterium MTC7]|nr:hypothetical protein A4S06_00305 [Erysipelotrichaceae bacterium MTC7]
MAKKKKYSELASKILELVGGPENIIFCEHCITRLRFNVKDKSLINDKELDELEGTNGRLWVGDQLQVIIGTSVGGVYDEVCKQGKLETSDEIKENLDIPKENKTVKDRLKGIVTTLTECIVPALGAMVAMGMFAAIVSVIGPTGLNVVSVESGVYKLLVMAQDGIMYFIPVVIAYTAARKFNCSPIFAILLVCIQLSSEWTTAVGDGSLTMFGIEPLAHTLNGQIIPVILQIWIMSYVEKGINKIMPDNFKFILVGVFELLIMLPIALFILTPGGMQLGLLLAYPITLLESISPVLVSLVAGGLYTLFVSVGMHSALSGIFVMDLFTTGVTYALLPSVFSQCWIFAALNIAIRVKTKNKALKETATESTIAAVVGGVMEPSIYAIYMKNIKIMIIACLGMAVTGATHRILGVGVYALSASNFLGITAFLAGGMDNLLRAIPGILIGCIVVFAAIMILGVDKKEATK